MEIAANKFSDVAERAKVEGFERAKVEVNGIVSC